jgi:Regulator of chromosome condensation (RCC1) repeat
MPTDGATPIRLPLENVARVAIGPTHACAIDVSNQLWCWGNNSNRQINDSVEATLGVTRVETGKLLGGIRGVGLGPSQTCLVDQASHVTCWGTDGAATISGPRAVDVAGEPGTTMPGDQPLVIDGAGRAFDLTHWQEPQKIGLFGDHNAWVTLGTPACALKRSGSLWCTDYLFGDEGDLLLVKLGLAEHVVKAGVGDLFMCALLDDGRVWCEGFNQLGQAATGSDTTFADGAFVAGVSDARDLAVDTYSACVVKDDGSVWCWGAYGPGLRSNVPVQVTGCEKQTQKPPTPPKPEVEPGKRFGEAARARGQAVCSCAGLPPEGLGDCIHEESFAPNVACLAALAPEDASRWECLADARWDEASCRHACSKNGNVDDCANPKQCPAATRPGLERYCSTRVCIDLDEPPVPTWKICDDVPDCLSGEDELNCSATPGRFQCLAPFDTPISGLCDGLPNCKDGSDERSCN